MTGKVASESREQGHGDGLEGQHPCTQGEWAHNGQCLLSPLPRLLKTLAIGGSGLASVPALPSPHQG